jgi:hypothetical protein
MMILAAIVVGLIPGAHANNGDTGPHGGRVVENKTSKLEVKIDRSGNVVDVYDLSPRKEAPKEKMNVTLYRGTGTGETVQLRAVNLKEGAPNDTPKYEGELKPNAGSYVGFELHFLSGNKNEESLRLEEPSK